MTDFPAVEQLIGAYFHQDYAVVSGSAQGAVDDFVSDEPGLARLAPTEILKILERTKTEDEARSMLTEFGLDYDPTMQDWPSHRDWLVNVAEQIEARLGTHDDES